MNHLNICMIIIIHLIGITNGETRVVNKCVNDHVLMECPHEDHCLIDVLSAYYGHPPRNHVAKNCTFTMGHCITNASDIWQRCHEKNQCSFLVRQSRDEVRNACAMPSQYVTVTYQCRCSGKCATLPDIENGKVSYTSSSLEYGTEARYSCNDRTSYNLAGPSERICERNGIWTGIKPTCSISTSRCPSSNHTRSTSYQNDCLLLYEHSLNWSESAATCSKSNGTLLTSDDENRMQYTKWWMNEIKIYGYIWLDTNDDTNQQKNRKCTELFRNQTHNELWEQRKTGCQYKDNFICVYSPFDDISTGGSLSRNQAIALGVGLGLGLCILIAAAVIISVFLWLKKPWDRSQKECKVLNSSQSVSSANLVAQEYLYSNTMDQNIQSQSNAISVVSNNNNRSDCTIEEEQGATYDDVYVPGPSINGNPSNGAPQTVRNKPPIKKKPKISLSKFRVYTAGQNDYENVKLHNLTASLKKRFLPKRYSSNNYNHANSYGMQNGTKASNGHPISSDIKESSFTDGTSCTCGYELGISKAANNQNSKINCNKCRKQHCKSNPLEKDDRGSNGICIVENDIYDADSLC